MEVRLALILVVLILGLSFILSHYRKLESSKLRVQALRSELIQLAERRYRFLGNLLYTNDTLPLAHEALRAYMRYVSSEDKLRYIPILERYARMYESLHESLAYYRKELSRLLEKYNEAVENYNSRLNFPPLDLMFGHRRAFAISLQKEGESDKGRATSDTFRRGELR